METTQHRITDVLDGFDTEQLKKIYILLFDVWCWDSGNESIKEIVDAIQKKIEEPNSVAFAQSQETSITHTSHGITSQLFKFNYGSLGLGSDLEFAIKMYLESDLLPLHGGIGVTLETQLKNLINSELLNNWKVNFMDAEISKLTLELQELKKRLDP